VSDYLCIVLAADVDDYVDWCRHTGRTPFDGTAWAISDGTGIAVTHKRTFQVTDRWRDNKHNRRIMKRLGDDRWLGGTVPYGDETGPWPTERVPDLNWPTCWQRVKGKLARPA
jgi:hypothetical protein